MTLISIQDTHGVRSWLRCIYWCTNLTSPRLSVLCYPLCPSFTRMRPYPSLLSIILFLQLFIQHFDRSTLRKVQTRDHSRPLVEEEKEYDGDISEDDKADSVS